MAEEKKELFAKINADLQKAMKEKKELLLSTLRMVKSKILYVNARGDLADNEILKIIKKYEYKLSEGNLDKDIDKFIKEAKNGTYQMDHRYGQEGLKIIKACFRMIKDEFKNENYKVARDCYFENCLFWRKAGNTTNAFVDATGTTDVERMLMFKSCEFFNTELATAIPAEAVTCSGGKQTEGLIALKDCSCWNVTLLKEASVGI